MLVGNSKSFQIKVYIKDIDNIIITLNLVRSASSQDEAIKEIMKNGIHHKNWLLPTSYYYPAHSIIKMEITDVEKDTN